jgi:hypothetical protein
MSEEKKPTEVTEIPEEALEQVNGGLIGLLVPAVDKATPVALPAVQNIFQKI